MNKEKLKSLRECQDLGDLLNAMTEDMSLAWDLLDSAESELRLRESITITDRNTRTMMAELHELRAWKVEAEVVHERIRNALRDLLAKVES